MTHTLPQTALACPTCKALKGAGYPQKNTVLVWVTTKEPDGLEPFCEPTKFAFYNNGDPRKVVAACPNSDELLAAIQDRWPEHTYSLHQLEQSWGARAYSGMWGKGVTPAEALAALYITLAVGAVKEGT